MHRTLKDASTTVKLSAYETTKAALNKNEPTKKLQMWGNNRSHEGLHCIGGGTERGSARNCIKQVCRNLADEVVVRMRVVDVI